MKMRFVGFARVSSKEQEEQGFSLDAQQRDIEKYVENQCGELVRVFRATESASLSENRPVFHEMLRLLRSGEVKADAIVFWRIDRASRNTDDSALLEKFQRETEIQVVYLDNLSAGDDPDGRFMRRIGAALAAREIEVSAARIRRGMRERADCGWYMGNPPYGYRHKRLDKKKSIVVVDEAKASKVRRIFELYATAPVTIQELGRFLLAQGVYYTDRTQRFPKSTLHRMLRSRAYLGEIEYHGQWRPGQHPALVSPIVWQEVQSKLTAKPRQVHDLAFAGGLIRCGHCGNLITGESVPKRLKTGEVKRYHYYRCTVNNVGDHPRHRISEAAIDEQFVRVFESMKVASDEVRKWIAEVMRAKAGALASERRARLDEIQRLCKAVQKKRDTLLTLRLEEGIDPQTYEARDMMLRDEDSVLRAQLANLSSEQTENGELAIKTFELSQSLTSRWLRADSRAKRNILELLLLNCTLNGVTLEFTMRKPFDVLVEGLSLNDGGGGGNRTRVPSR